VSVSGWCCRTRRLIDLETHESVFTWMLQRLADAGSSDDWTHPHDPDAKITKMKDGRTHLAHKAEQVVDLETGAIVGVTVQDADDGDTTTSIETLIEAAEQVEAGRPDGDGIEDVVGDKGDHSNQSLVDLERSVCAATSPSPIGPDGIGGSTRRARRGVSESTAHSRGARPHGCCGYAANAWKDPSRISLKPGAPADSFQCRSVPHSRDSISLRSARARWFSPRAARLVGCQTERYAS
jgi:hypothetical protein